MKTSEELDLKFQEAVDKINNYTQPLPADLLLKLYAYYKIANKNFSNPGSKKPLINAFKTNALFQAKNISEREAKEKYIELAKYILDTNYNSK
ncbi:acyl-CoA-binding protein [Flavobacteriaceae bacterium R38]|nr:acyl-CoA-binding protein [Flavobacteriaceae bacterium R38]